MVCLICDHTMAGIGHGMFHCARCGSLLLPEGTPGPLVVPALVLRCREFAADPLLPLLAVSGEIGKLWHRLGITESINVPAERPSDATAP